MKQNKATPTPLFPITVYGREACGVNRPTEKWIHWEHGAEESSMETMDRQKDKQVGPRGT